MRSLLIGLVVSLSLPLAAQGPYEDALAVGVDFGGLADILTPSLNLTGSGYTHPGFSADLTIGLPLAFLHRERRTGDQFRNGYRKLGLAIAYRLPDVRSFWLRLRRTDLRFEINDTRQRYDRRDDSYLTKDGTRRVTYDRARVRRSVHSLRFGVGRRLVWTDRWVLDVQTMVGVRQRSIKYSRLVNAVRSPPPVGGFRPPAIFSELGADRRAGVTLHPDFVFKVRLLYRLDRRTDGW